VFYLPCFGQSSERPETIVIPVSSLGEVTEVRKQILQNTLEDELKSHFRLISQKRFEEVQERVFEELDYDECTEEQCIVMIQEMLQVENVFHLQVLGEGDDTQLSLSWRTLDEKRKETEICVGCGTFKLNNKVKQLIGELIFERDDQKKLIKILYRKTPGHGTEFFYRWIKLRGKWLNKGDDKEQVKYIGQISEGVPNGQGTIIYPNGVLKYEGEFLDGLPNGIGTETMSDRKYTGGWKDGNRNGHGTYTFSDGRKYVGEFKNHEYNGQGTFTYPSGRKYVGEWKDSEIWNITEYDKNGNIIGKYVVGRFIGVEEEILDKCVVIEKSQRGVLFQRKINGVWEWCKDGNEKTDGKYLGEIRNGVPNGQGTQTLPNGTKYEGKWKKGKYNGQGTLTSYDGEKYVGEWKDGYIWKGKRLNKNGTIIRKY